MGYNVARATGADKDADAIPVDLDLADIAATIDQIADGGVSRSAIVWALQVGWSELWDILDGKAEPSPDLAQRLDPIPFWGQLPDAPAGGDKVITVTIGRHARDNDATTIKELTVAGLLDFLTDHQEGPKDGRCIIPARFRNGVRRKADADEIGVLMLDIDDGHMIEEAEAALRRLNWTAAIYTTHSHTPERHKFRIALPLARPWRASDYPDQNTANDAWKGLVEAAAGALGLKHDAACTDPSRLFFLPRHPPGVVPVSRVVVGAFCDLHALAPPAPAASPAKPSAPAARSHQAAPAEYVDADGVVFDLQGWMAGHGARFKIADALAARSPGVMRGKVADKVKHHILCPCAHEHGDPSADFATFVINAGESETKGKGFVVHCRHAHCAGRDRQAFVAQMLADGSLTTEDLTDPAFLLPEPDPVEAAVQRLNADQAVVRVGGKTLVLIEETDLKGLPIVTFEHPKERAVWYENDRVWVDKKSISAFDLWKKSPERRQYARVDFAPARPPGAEAGGFYNLWRGFAVEPNPHASCERFLGHIGVNVCLGNEQHFLWLMGWLAHMVQRPEERPETSVAFVGEQGTGKSIVGKYVGALFPAHYTAVSHTDHLLGKFNAHLKQALLIQAEEAFWAGDKQAQGRLKDLITSETRNVEPKFADVFQVKNHSRVLITSNEDRVVPAAMEERRFAVFKVSSAHMQDRAYFAAIAAEMENGGLGGLLHYLLTFDLSTIDVRTVPRTEGLLEQKIASLGSTDKWWLSCLDEGSLGLRFGEGWQEEAGTREVHQAYQEYAKKVLNDHYPMPEAQFGQWFRKAADVTRYRAREGRARAYRYRIPALDVCRAAFDRRLGHSYSWGEE